ncbi:MAG: NUDIX domain-containing protein [Bryobacteraceae bacterium]
MMLAGDVTRLLSNFAVGEDGEAAKSRDLTLALLAWSLEPFSRHVFTPGHITATGVVLSPKRRRVLLVHHGRLDRWLLPGGHVEAQDSIISDTASREVLEETGARLQPELPKLVGWTFMRFRQIVRASASSPRPHLCVQTIQKLPVFSNREVAGADSMV